MASPAENTEDSEPNGGSLSANIYRTMRRWIITGEYPQGMRLNEQRLAAALKVSRVPVREVLPQLTTDGFVEMFPHRSAVVSTWTVDDVHNLFDARLALEVEAARYATRKVARGASMAKLAQVLHSSDEVVPTGDDLRIAESSTLFHTRVVDLTGNGLMMSLMQTVSHRMSWLFYLTSQRDAQQACAEHHELFDAIASGNEEVARAVAYTHIERGREPSLSSFDAVVERP
ncbi:GntR family transcriptional regulator [Amycolatopsis sp. GM8]|uniref:GntR family transcriptional regulator n=1 Tax=Amycolatopsis sp. GM8 TaxID=2896530 RepID=UPI001F1BBC38|nr:GntR family transcriptional regulator [Amycolatopsis sp. GM8]